MGIPSMNQGEENGFYDGSRAFVWLAELAGMPVDQVNFLLCQFSAVGLAFAFRYYLNPRYVSSETRHGASLLLGLVMIIFCFGRQALHLACLSTISYAILKTASPKISHRLVLIISILYLSGVHIKRQIHSYGGYTLDISGPLMVLMQKVTSLAFSLHDGRARKYEDLTPYQKKQVIREIPNPLEYYSYLFHFHAIMVGPAILYADYIDFIDGTQFLKNSASSSEQVKDSYVEPAVGFVVFKKLLLAMACAVFFLKASPVFPINFLKEEEFVIDMPLWKKMLFITASTTIVRMKYYHAWLIADSICNASGLGFNGYSSDGEPEWDLTSNVDILKFEFGLSLRDSIEQWNKFTNRWLRFVVYERTTENRTFLTYTLSAIWHGFYPGYYLTFFSGALFTVASRAVRRSVRPYFLNNRFKKIFYDFLTFLTTRIAMAYLTFSFILLEFWASLRVYAHMFFWLHLLCLAAIIVLPKILPPPKAKMSD